jgi:hypothetical protein
VPWKLGKEIVVSEYEAAVFVWSAVAAVGVLVPLAAALVKETQRAIECVRRDGAPSRPSLPHSSAPSHPGY